MAKKEKKGKKMKGNSNNAPGKNKKKNKEQEPEITPAPVPVPAPPEPEPGPLVPMPPAPEPAPELPSVEPTPAPEPETLPEPQPEPTPPPVSEFEGEYEIDILDTDEDQSDYIQAQIDRIPDGVLKKNKVVFPAGKWARMERVFITKYLQQSCVNVVGRKGLYFTTDKDNPCVFYQLERDGIGRKSHRRIFWVTQCKDIEFKYLAYDGPNKDTGIGRAAFSGYSEFEHFIDARECEDLEISYCSIKHTWGDAVYVAGNGYSRRVKIHHNTFHYNGRQGVGAANSVDGLEIYENDIQYGARSAIDLENHTPAGKILNVKIYNNVLNSHFGAIGAVGSGEVSHVEIWNNRHNGKLVHASGNAELRRKNWHVHDNTCLDGVGSGQAPIWIGFTDNVRVERNYMPIVATQGRKAVDLTGCGGDLCVAGNDFGVPARVVLNDVLADCSIDVSGNISEILPEITLNQPQVEIPLDGYAFYGGINVGGPEHLAANGDTYQADTDFTGGTSGSRAEAIIAGADEPELYRTYRHKGEFSYSIPVENGAYLLVLGFMEHYYSRAYNRVFDVLVQGEKVIENLDPCGYAGGAFKARRFPVQVEVTDGLLAIDIPAGMIGTGVLNVIELYRPV